MSRGINKVILIGNLGANPEVRNTTNGSVVANISVATSSAWKDKQTGNLQEATEWHRVVFFNRLAEIVAQYLKKGSKVFVEGSIKTKKWKDKNGVDRYTTEIIANQMQMLDSKGNQNANNQTNNTKQTYQHNYYPNSGQNTNNQSTQTAINGQAVKQNQDSVRYANKDIDPFDDDIPF